MTRSKALLVVVSLGVSIWAFGSSGAAVAQMICPPLNCTAQDAVFSYAVLAPALSGDNSCDDSLDMIDVVVVARLQTQATRYDPAVWAPDGGDIGGEPTCAGVLFNGGSGVSFEDADSCADVKQTTAEIEAPFRIPCIDDDNDQILDPVTVWGSWYNSAGQLNCSGPEYAGTTAKCELVFAESSIEVPPICGDGEVDSGEQCDDGNDASGDGCFECQLEDVPPFCGDGNVDSGEQCDDGDVSNTDACLDTCQDASCGDGYVWAGVEECDTAGSSATCTSQCTIPIVPDPRDVPSLPSGKQLALLLLLLTIGFAVVARQRFARR